MKSLPLNSFDDITNAGVDNRPTNRQTEKQTNKQTDRTIKQYAPIFSSERGGG